MSAPNSKLGIMFVLAGAALFGMNGGASRVAMSTLTPESLTTLRVTGAALVYLVLALMFHRSALRIPRGRAVPLIAGLGLFGVASLQLTYNLAITRLPLGIALLIQYLSPVIVILWVRFVRREQVHPRMWLAVSLAIIGLAVVGQVWKGMTLDGLGVVMALLSAMSFATFFLLSEHNIGQNDPLQVILWAFAVAAVATNLIEPVWHAPSLSGTSSMLGRLDHLPATTWVVVLWVIALGTVVPFLLQMLALRHLPATVVTVVSMLEPVIANTIGWLWFKESMTAQQVLGASAVLGGIFLAQTSRRPRASHPQHHDQVTCNALHE